MTTRASIIKNSLIFATVISTLALGGCDFTFNFCFEGLADCK